MSGKRGRSGRRRKATCARNGRVAVNLDMISEVTINGHEFEHVVLVLSKLHYWYVDGERFTDYAAAAAEFVRRVNG